MSKLHDAKNLNEYLLDKNKIYHSIPTHLWQFTSKLSLDVINRSTNNILRIYSIGLKPAQMANFIYMTMI